MGMIDDIFPSDLLEELVISRKRECNSGQCMSAEENVKKKVGVPTFVTMALGPLSPHARKHLYQEC